jgi:arginine decarboxylase
MPGHQQGRGLCPECAELMKCALFDIDLTELPGLDDLHCPTGPIKEAQDRAARLFGADKTFFLVNGTTVGIHAAILSLCRQDEEILLPRDIHRSVIGACILAGVYPRYLPIELDAEFMIPLTPTRQEIEEELGKNPEIKAVFATNPSYYGLAGDLAGIVKTAHDFNVPVIVDEAHGSHFAFSDRLPATALSVGADISIQSTHKTLGAFTQASMLHVSGSLSDNNEVARQLKLLQSTSPSYILMASLDATVAHMESSGRLIVEQAIDLAFYARSEISNIDGLKCLGEKTKGKNRAIAVDPTKLYISAQELGLTGIQLAEVLLQKHRIQVELCDQMCILCMITIGTSAENVERLIKALKEIVVGTRTAKRENLWEKIDNIMPQPNVKMSPRDAWFSDKRQVLLKDSEGEIAAEIIAPYPPGVPLLCPGELITREIIEAVRCLKKLSVAFQGPADPEITSVYVVSR